MRSVVLAFAVVAFLSLAGCSKPGTVPVGGTVTLNGKPVENAEVMFNPKQGRMAVGTTDASGHFTLSTAASGDGAMPGEYVVTLVEFHPPDKPPAMPPGGGLLPSRFPPAYADPATSPLVAVVKGGKENKFQFEVKK